MHVLHLSNVGFRVFNRMIHLLYIHFVVILIVHPVVLCCQIPVFWHRPVYLLFGPHDRVRFAVLPSQGLHRNVHEGAAHLDDARLMRLQLQTILNLNQGAELARFVFNRELESIEADTRVRPRHTYVGDSHVLVVATAQLVHFFVHAIHLVRCKQIYELAGDIFTVNLLQHKEIFIAFNLEIKKCVFPAVFSLKLYRE